MTYFWKGILDLLDVEELNHVFQGNYKSKLLPKNFVKLLKQKNVPIINIQYNSMSISDDKVEENFNKIKEINPREVYNNYSCSIFEPIFFLISHLFSYDIIHNYNGYHITYTCPIAKGKLKYGSHSNYFYSIRKELYS